MTDRDSTTPRSSLPPKPSALTCRAPATVALGLSLAACMTAGSSDAEYGSAGASSGGTSSCGIP